MAKFNILKKRTKTHEGAPGYIRDAKTELFLLAVANLVGEDTFYEAADRRDDRFATLVRDMALDDVAWLTELVRWLRAGAHLRSAPLVAAAEAVHARLAAGVHGANRTLVDVALQRADEPGELLAYWRGRFGRAVPQPVKRGLADAARRLYDERTLLKYDTAAKAYRFADVIDTVRPRPRDVRQLWESGDRTPGALRAAGVTWESLAGRDAMDKAAWEAAIPSMGVMALARNLRNFDEAGVSDEIAAAVAAKLATTPSRMFPFRWFAAYEQAPSLRWAAALDAALIASLANVPRLDGRTLVLVDTSASMTQATFSRRSKMTPAKAAAVFGVVLAARSGADLYGFADGTFAHRLAKGGSVLREVDRFVRRTGEVGHGTRIATSLRTTYDGHDRVFVISDMQTMDGGTMDAVPRNVPLYGFNLGGYRPAAFDAGKANRMEFGGLTDATFRMVPLIEAGRAAAWPWEKEHR